MSTWRRAHCVVIPLLLALVAGACGDDDSTASTTSTTEATTTTEDPVAAEEAAVMEAYEAHWEAFLVAVEEADPDAEVLTEHTTGAALEQLRSAIRRYASEGVAGRGHYEHDARVVYVGTSSATVEDCLADHTELFLLASDEVIDSAQGKVTDFRVELSLEDGVWKVTNMENDTDHCPA